MEILLKIINLFKKIRFLCKITMENNKKKTKSNKTQFNETNISDMMREVNAMLQKNPEMVKKVSKCVNNIFENDTLMSKLVSEINTGIVLESDSGSDSESASDSGSDSSPEDSEPVKVINEEKKNKKNSTNSTKKDNKNNKNNKNNNKVLGPVSSID
jgi:hypothetical protein